MSIDSKGVLSRDAAAESEERRAFLKTSGMGVLGVALPASVASAASPASSPSVGQHFPFLGEEVGRTVLRMARDIYPHDRVPDQHYISALQPYDKGASGDPQLKGLIVDGVAGLNAAAAKRFGKAYADIPAEGDRVTLLYAIEQSAFFQKIRGDLLIGFYNQKAVWQLFGYEGSSWEKGGYLNRGFDDIGWL